MYAGVGAAEPGPAGASSPKRLSNAQASWAQRALLPLGRDWIRSPGLTAVPQTPQTVAYLAVIATLQAYGVALDSAARIELSLATLQVGDVALEVASGSEPLPSTFGAAMLAQVRRIGNTA